MLGIISFPPTYVLWVAQLLSKLVSLSRLMIFLPRRILVFFLAVNKKLSGVRTEQTPHTLSAYSVCCSRLSGANPSRSAGLYKPRPPVQHVRVLHGGPDISMPTSFLHRSRSRKDSPPQTCAPSTRCFEAFPALVRPPLLKPWACVGGAETFKNARKLAAFLGLTPRQHLSGSSLRKAFFMPAMVAIRFNPVIKVFAA